VLHETQCLQTVKEVTHNRMLKHNVMPDHSRINFPNVRFEVFMAVTMKSAVFWDINVQFLSHRRHITSLPQSPASSCYVRVEIFMAVTMKNVVFWGVTPCDSCMNWHSSRATQRNIPEDGALQLHWCCAMYYVHLSWSMKPSGLWT
jgi:hypothetical protein